MLLIRNGRILAKDGSEVAGDILIDGYLISQVGIGLQVPEGCEVLDVGGDLITPGLVDSHVYIGLLETEAGDEGRDDNEKSGPIQPHLRSIDAIHWTDHAFGLALAGGVTTVITGPGTANVMGGQSLAMKTLDCPLERRILQETVSLRITLSESAKRTYREEGPKIPTTRMGTASLVRENFLRAREYAESRKEGKNGKIDLKLESLAKVLAEKLPVTFYARRANDIATALRLIKEFGLNGVIAGATEAHLISKHIAASGVPVIFIPLIHGRLSYEERNATFKTIAALKSAGVEFAISSGAPSPPSQHLALLVALCAKVGLTAAEALNAVTLNPARFFGLDDVVGSIEPGKQADIVVWKGHPFFDLLSHPKYVISGGRIVYNHFRDENPW